jgi:hypothetical protein
MNYKTQHRKIKIDQHEPHHTNKILKCVAMVNKESLMKKEMSYKLDVYSG